ncbi:pectinesterase inhibitor 3 [Cajanus cajan]|uniref:21 kDa protein n=1 Tax=Cajanus cajan TaxID=3821 RepID=A0A151SSK4_CAJCA|nr:pectinesterase inhibitor 3 [Cajanus cajan]KYP57810.1 21 kDa protein [Cajanus cajan]
MQTNTLAITVLSAYFLLLLCAPSAAAARAARDPLRSWCAQARYPSLCVETLSNFSNSSAKPLELAQAGVKVTLGRTRSLSLYLRTLKSRTFGKRQRVALSDCVNQVSDSVTQLSRTLNELQHLHAPTFQWQMSNAQTWTSAALTNGDACLDGFSSAPESLKMEFKRRLTDVAMLTSNALYLITRLGHTTNSRN